LFFQQDSEIDEILGQMEEPIITHSPPDKPPEKAPVRGVGYMSEQVEIVAPPPPKKKKVSHLKRNFYAFILKRGVEKNVCKKNLPFQPSVLTIIYSHIMPIQKKS